MKRVAFLVLCIMLALAGSVLALARAQRPTFLLVAAEPSAIVTGFGADIYALELERGNRVNVTHTPFEGEINPASARNDRDFSFTRMNQDFVRGLLAEICLDSLGEARRCFPARGRWDSGATWSPDGEWLLYHTPGSEGALTVLLHPRTGEAREIETTTDSLLDAAWSPGGTHLAAVHLSPGFSRIVTIDIAGAGMTTLSPADDTRYLAPTWGPDGAQVAYLANSRLAVTALDRPGEADIITPETLAVTAPAWSPDGALIAFTDTLTWHVYVVQPDGSGLRRISDLPRPLIDDTLSWSRDGRYLAWSASGGPASGQNVLSIYDARADTLRQVNNRELYFYAPVWW